MEEIRSSKPPVVTCICDLNKSRARHNYKLILKIIMYYYFDDIMRVGEIDIDADFSGILLEKKLHKEKNKNVLMHDVSYKT